ncbi:MAG: hypothetical protein A4E19_06005 [Nitrospira sp. SG-bin1]|nr:MAG: hypothetical protein A4E19_06005 [Nitrospira sp. SG-bin1]
MRSKIINIDFFEVILPPDSVMTFNKILETVSQSPDDDSRVVDRGDAPLRLQAAKKEGHHWEGEMIRIRMKDLPVKAAIDGTTEPIELEDNEGLGEETAFLFSVPTKTLALQRNRHGVSASSFASYFTKKGGVEFIELHPILRRDALKELAKMDLVRKFDVRVASVTNGAAARSQSAGVNAILDIHDVFKAPSVSVSVSMKRKPGSLSLPQIMQTVKQFCKGIDNAVVEKILITGQDEDGETALLDLLKWRIVETIVLPVLDDDRRISAKDRRRAVNQAWENKKGEITSLVHAEKS